MQKTSQYTEKDLENIAQNARLLADALITPSNHGDTYWDEYARAILEGILLHVETRP